MAQAWKVGAWKSDAWKGTAWASDDTGGGSGGVVVAPGGRKRSARRRVLGLGRFQRGFFDLGVLLAYVFRK